MVPSAHGALLPSSALLQALLAPSHRLILAGIRSPWAEVGDGSSRAGEGAATASHGAGKGWSRAGIHPRQQQQEPACAAGKSGCQNPPQTCQRPPEPREKGWENRNRVKILEINQRRRQHKAAATSQLCSGWKGGPAGAFSPLTEGPESSMNSRADKEQPDFGKQGWGCLRIANNDLILEIS